MAAIFLIVLGFGRIFATISAIELHLRRTKGDKTQQRRKKMKAASPIIFEGMIGVLVGDVIIVVLILSGIFTGQSWQILVTLGAVFLALVIILDVVLRYLEEGRKNAP